jgi:hypothetical protein
MARMATPDAGERGLTTTIPFVGTLMLDSRVLCDQQLNERMKQRLASLSDVVNELKKTQVKREFLL